SANGVIKLNPLAYWPAAQVWGYIKEHELPYNPLHDEGYPSLGCWPCTRPVQSGEGPRAGRWPGRNKTECGIHIEGGQVQQRRRPLLWAGDER
ncbi:MAG: phosphoadenosine phosphosulfate reductase family protein, partial [Anaerolineae bacterium]|nr:phosphoadenosine phosphosulfate reductase family protein [Anaerolineae bacterium]